MMKIFKILICAAFVLVISACHDKDKTIYEYPDDDPTTAEKGNAGDPCKKNDDCKEGLLCIDKVCSEPGKDDDSVNDSDENPVDDKDDTDTTPTDDADSDTNDPDITPTDDDADTGSNDEDEPEDSDTKPDEDQDIPEYFPECGNGLRDPGEECDNGLENSDESGIPGVTCRTECIFARCQDGIVDEGEICDDGNAFAGDYCSPDCHAVTGYCGDGTQQTNEVCDPGLEPYCKDDCSGIAGYCGDGIKQKHEVCDKAEPGEGGGEGIGPFYCSVNCKEIMGSCGDGDLQLNEECDDGDNNGRYGYCNSTCSGNAPRCGDGNIDIGHEKCDDGNTIDGDYCSADCKTSFGSCGDGIKQSFEECDNANYGDGVDVYCSDDCQQLYGRCGDGRLNPEAGEECDEGANNNQTYCPYGSSDSCTLCSPACRYTEGIPRYCGDGVVSNLAGEECDKATFGAGTGPYYCSADCTKVIGSCGDGIKQNNEECDPGIDPYCSADCKKSEGSCGDGIKNGNEDCDFGSNNGKTDCDYGIINCEICTTSCKLTGGTAHYCGNHTVDEGEDCDDGPENGQYGKCKINCAGPGPRCGDGITQSEYGETCDNGSYNGKYYDYSPGYCNSDCKGQGEGGYCGDGIKQPEESCDDGELNGQYGKCQAGCHEIGPHCGDGNIDESEGEVCDDGAENGSYGKCKADCSGLGPRCGDGIINGSSEACDNGDDNGKTECDYGETSCKVCTNECKQADGTTAYCGDGIRNGTEACDEGTDNGQIPCAYGEESCEVCSTRCRLVSGNTSYCGDGNRDPAHEACDAGSANGDYNAPCNRECSAVPPKCGDDNIDTAFGEICDDKANNGKYKFSAPGYCNGDCQGYGEGGYCGDGIRNGTELCDAGTLNSNYNATCNTSCSGTPAYCGDGKIDSIYGETCDDGELNGQYGHCNSACSAKLECGDGIQQPEEDCDDGDENGNYNKCKTDCSGLTAYCGDGTIDSGHEDCDDGELNGSYGHCKLDCAGFMPKCGDGNIDGIYGEVCDDGELNGQYGKCNSTCSDISECGDGIQQPEEFCDNGVANGTYQNCNDSCTGIAGDCGDGILQKAACGSEEGCVQIPEADEQCDKGYMNIESGDPTNCAYGERNCYFCSKECRQIEGTASYCGDGNVDTANGENCDDGIADGTFGHCDKKCQIMVNYRCGDGKIQKSSVEQCGSLPICSESITDHCCEVVTFAQGDLPEICDDGTDNGTEKHCNAACDGWTPYCGDGIIQRENCEGYEGHCVEIAGMTEKCDDGGSNGYYGFCKEDCSGKREERCGDGILHTSDCTDYNNCYTDPGTGEVICPDKPNCEVVPGATEICDEGADNGLYYGHCDEYCSNTTWNGYCGDKKIQKATEEECTALLPGTPRCPDTNSQGICCEVVTFKSGEESKKEICDEGKNDNGYHGHCNETCNGISSCGDGVVGKDEICEQNDAIGMMPCNLISQFQSGTIGNCDDKCTPDLTGCVNADSYTSPFFKTGQTLCYNNNSVDTCTGNTGYDFYGQEPEPNFSYTEQNFALRNEDTVVEETLSKLFWQRDTLADYGYEKDDEFIYTCEAHSSCTFEEAENYCADLRLGDYRDWRLPTITEFSTIMNYHGDGNRINSIFTNTRGEYWTQEGKIFSSENGTVDNPSGNHQIKCVRSDKNGCLTLQCMPKEQQMILDFEDSAVTSDDDTVFVFWYFGNPRAQDTWEKALKYCSSRDVNGFNKMRLPTVNELTSFIGSRITVTGKVWTSTTVKGSPTNAYAVDFSNTLVTIDSKDTSNYIICVE